MVRRARHKVRDYGWNALMRRLATFRAKPHVVVGLFGEKGSTQHKGTTFTNAQVGSVHEFGLGNIPERSFIRGTVDERIVQIQKMQKKLARTVLFGRSGRSHKGRGPVRQPVSTREALTLLGLFVKGQIQGRISKGIPPPNKPSTIARKKSSKPLIDTGQLRGAIDYEVRRA